MQTILWECNLDESPSVLCLIRPVSLLAWCTKPFYGNVTCDVCSFTSFLPGCYTDHSILLLITELWNANILVIKDLLFFTKNIYSPRSKFFVWKHFPFYEDSRLLSRVESGCLLDVLRHIYSAVFQNNIKQYWTERFKVMKLFDKRLILYIVWDYGKCR